MSWTVLVVLVLALGFALVALLLRRAELARIRRTVAKREEAVRQGSEQAQLHHPVIDLTRCLGCATCEAVCPEGGVLEIVHGQAVVVNGARCVGVAACERECPVGAIQITVRNVDTRDDIPVIDAGFEAIGSPGLFLAGEVTAHALIKTAIEHGTAVASEVARRYSEGEVEHSGVLDLCIVGAGPAGLACSLEAKRHGLRFLTLDQERSLGGTVAKYPRRKLVLTQPVDLPLHGRLKRTSYTKEELIDLWTSIAEEQQLPIEGGEIFRELERDDAGHYIVRTETGAYKARHVCLAVGRRGVPRKLGVPGEDASKVAYSLLDAHSYQDRRVLVVGGGDSAVETALGLAEQSGNRVTLSYRKESFFRVKERNQERLEKARAAGKLDVRFSTHVVAIDPDAVELEGHGGERDRLPNDEVFVMAGGTAPTELLTRAGVSFDPKLREKSAPIVEQGSGLGMALGAGFFLALAALIWALWHRDYYSLPEGLRPTLDKHDWLRPGRGAGLFFGITAASMVAINLLYLVRRSPRLRIRIGSLQAWMTSHIATGILALLCALLHGAMAPGDTPGGHALWALAVLLVTGAIGRYFYAYLPRAANGRELKLAEVRERLGNLSVAWNQGERRIREINELVAAQQWKRTLPGRIVALLRGTRDLRKLLVLIEYDARKEGIDDERLGEMCELTRRAYRTAMATAHYEDLRALLNSWRFLHRWVALLMVLLMIVHVVHSLLYGYGGGSAQ